MACFSSFGFYLFQPSRWLRWGKPLAITGGSVLGALALGGIIYGAYRSATSHKETEGGCKKKMTQYFGCQFAFVERHNRPSLQYLQQKNIRELIGNK